MSDDDSLTLARQIAAQAWCADANAHKIMDVDLCDAFAHLMAAELDRLRADNAQLAKECSALSQAADIAAATLEDFIYYGDDRWPSDETVEAVLATIKIAQENRGTRDMLDDAVALRAELDRVTAKRDAAVALAREYRCAIEEVRASLHAMGRRPEHCHEMSVLDDALALDAPPA